MKTTIYNGREPDHHSTSMKVFPAEKLQIKVSAFCFTIKGHTETGENCDRKRSKTTTSVVSESQQIVWFVAHRTLVSFLPERRCCVSFLTKKSHCYHVKRRQRDMPWPWKTTDEQLKSGRCCGLIKHKWTSLVHRCVTSTVKHGAGMYNKWERDSKSKLLPQYSAAACSILWYATYWSEVHHTAR